MQLRDLKHKWIYSKAPQTSVVPSRPDWKLTDFTKRPMLLLSTLATARPSIPRTRSRSNGLCSNTEKSNRKTMGKFQQRSLESDQSLEVLPRVVTVNQNYN